MVANPFLSAIANPWATGLSARIPDGNLFPTATAQVKWQQQFTTDASGNLAVMLCPSDVFCKPTSTAYSMLVSSYAGSSSLTGATLFSAANWTALPQLDGFYSDCANGRIVSAGIQAEFMGTTQQDSGLIAGGLLVGDQMLSDGAINAAKFPVVTSFAGFTSLETVDTNPLRQGLEVLYYPACKEDFTYRNAVTASASTLSYSPATNSTVIAPAGTPLVNVSPSKLALWITGAQASTTVVNCQFVINIEFVPKLGIIAGARGGGSQPGWLESVYNYVADRSNVVHAFIGYTAPLVGSAMVGFGGRYLHGLAQGNGGAPRLGF